MIGASTVLGAHLARTLVRAGAAAAQVVTIDESASIERRDRVMVTELEGVWLMAQALARRLVAQKSGVSIASIADPRAAGVIAPHATAKAGMFQPASALASE